MSKLPNIQILRALAASSVVVYHAGVESTYVCTNTNQPCGYDFWTGGFGVGLFFIISGFIMVTTSWNEFAVPGASVTFLRRRIIRIVPLYWLLTSVAVVGVFFVPTMLNVPVLDSGYVAASYLFWPVARVNGLVRPIANLGWTLNLEMMFYALFSLALIFGRVRGLAAAIGFLVLFTILQMAGMFSSTGKLPSVALNFWSDPIILNFVVGMLLAVAYRSGWRFGAVEAVIFLAISFILALAGFQLDGFVSSFPENHIVSRAINGIPPIFLFVAAAIGPQVDVRKTFWAIAMIIGDASYSLYLVHPFALRSFGKLWTKFVGTHLPVWNFTLVCLVFAPIVGLLCYRLVEQPLLKLLSVPRLPQLPSQAINYSSQSTRA